MRGNKLIHLAAALVAAGLVSAASAASITFSGTGFGAGGTPLAAQVNIDLTGSTLTVTLSNTASVASDVNANMLTGVFWHNPGDIGGTLDHITIPAGSGVIATAGGSTDIGMFGYAHTLSGSQSTGVGSAGYLSYDSTVLGPGGTSPPNSPDGPAGSLVSASTVGPFNDPVVRNTEIWVVTGVSTFNLNSISNVLFRYGTALTDTSFPPGNPPPPPVPLPAAVWSGMALLAGLGLVAKARKKSHA